MIFYFILFFIFYFIRNDLIRLFLLIKRSISNQILRFKLIFRSQDSAKSYFIISSEKWNSWLNIYHTTTNIALHLIYLLDKTCLENVSVPLENESFPPHVQGTAMV